MERGVERLLADSCLQPWLSRVVVLSVMSKGWASGRVKEEAGSILGAILEKEKGPEGRGWRQKRVVERV